MRLKKIDYNIYMTLCFDDLAPYQKEALRFVLSVPSSGLFLKPGSGKTIIALSALTEWAKSENPFPALIMSSKFPASQVWKQEADNWEHTQHLKFSLVLGAKNKREKSLSVDSDIFVTNYENAVWLEAQGKKFKSVVCDESHRIKGNGVNAKALKKICAKAQHVIALTGTPAPQGLIDLYTQVYILDHGHRLGKYRSHFIERWFSPKRTGYFWGYVPKKEAFTEIMGKISGICFSLPQQEGADSSKKIERTIWLSFDDKTLRQYKALKRKMILKLTETTITAAEAGTLINKLTQFCNGAIYGDDGKCETVHDIKLDALGSIYSEMDSPLLVAYFYKSDMERIKRKFHFSKELTMENMDDWNAGRIPMALANYSSSISEGINLQKGGHTIVWFSNTWSSDKRTQFNARLHRKGQKNDVMIFYLVFKGSIEERLMTRVGDKIILQEEVIRELIQD